MGGAKRRELIDPTQVEGAPSVERAQENVEREEGDEAEVENELAEMLKDKRRNLHEEDGQCD